VSLVVNVDENARPQSGSGSIVSPAGGALSVSPCCRQRRYDALPPHSAKFNSERDNPLVEVFLNTQ